MHADAAKAYARDLMERISGSRPNPDSDGDLPIRLGGALFDARVAGDSDASIQ